MHGTLTKARVDAIAVNRIESSLEVDAVRFDVVS
jgi:hypothetical protein